MSKRYEKKTEPVAPAPVFYGRMANSISIALLILAACLAVGMLGYHFLAGMVWIDALHYASMILSGMGPVVEIQSNGGKLFPPATHYLAV